MSAESVLREVEAFLFHEADLLDSWRLEEWLGLWAPDGRYLVAPVGISDPMSADPDKVLFLIADDHTRIEQRVVRLMKSTAYAEYPHSRLRHFLTNIRIVSSSPEEVVVTANFLVHRSKDSVTDLFPGQQRSVLRREGEDGSLRIKEKRCSLDLDSLAPQGKLSVIL